MNALDSQKGRCGMAKIMEAVVSDSSSLQQDLKAMGHSWRIEWIAQTVNKHQIVNRNSLPVTDKDGTMPATSGEQTLVFLPTLVLNEGA